MTTNDDGIAELLMLGFEHERTTNAYKDYSVARGDRSFIQVTVWDKKVIAFEERYTVHHFPSEGRGAWVNYKSVEEMLQKVTDLLSEVANGRE